MQPYFHLFGLSLPAYGMMALLGGVVAVLFAMLHNRGGRFVKQSELGLCAVYALVGMIIGAKILALITEIPFFIEHAGIIFSSMELIAGALLNGWVFYGGLIGGLIGALIYCRSFGEDYFAVLSAAAPSIPLFHMFGRVGCFLAGCCYGVPHEHGIAFTESLAAPNGIPLLPVQLMEAGANLVIFAVLLILQRKLEKKWLVLPLYLLLYAVTRFTLEFWRGDSIRGVAILSTSQWISIAIFVVGAILLLRRDTVQNAAVFIRRK